MCRDGYPHLSKLKTLVIKSKCRINTWFTRHYAFRIVSTSCISFVLPQAAGLIHSAAPPLPKKFLQLFGGTDKGSTVVRHPLAGKRNSARVPAVSSACRTALFSKRTLFLHADSGIVMPLYFL